MPLKEFGEWKSGLTAELIAKIDSEGFSSYDGMADGRADSYGIPQGNHTGDCEARSMENVAEARPIPRKPLEDGEVRRTHSTEDCAMVRKDPLAPNVEAEAVF